MPVSGKQRLFRRGLGALGAERRAMTVARSPWCTGPHQRMGPLRGRDRARLDVKCFQKRAVFGLGARASEPIWVIPRVMDMCVSVTERALWVGCFKL
jgi:hypothetical protein